MSPLLCEGYGLFEIAIYGSKYQTLKAWNSSMPEATTTEEANVVEPTKWFYMTKDRWVPVAILAAFIFYNLLVFSPNTNTPNATFSRIARNVSIGMVLSQPLLCAFWAAWSLDPPLWRIPSAIGSLFLFCCCVIKGGTDPIGISILFGTIVFIAWLIFTLLAYWKTFRLQFSGEPSLLTIYRSTETSNHQFSIKYLLFWTTLISFLLMVPRILFLNLSVNDLTKLISLDYASEIFLPITCYVIMCVPAFLALLLPLHKNNWQWWKTAITTSLISLLCVYVATALLHSQIPSSTDLLETGGIITGSIIGTGIPALALRWAGYRVVRDVASPTPQ